MNAPFTVSGSLAVPGDKSLTHRALLVAAAARGRSRLSGLLTGADCQSTAAVLRDLGIPVPPLPASGAALEIESPGLEGWRAPERTLDCGNSGTTTRLLLGLLAGRPFAATLTGDESLRSRPMRRVTDPLQEMGAEMRELERPDRLPVEIRGGTLHTIHHRSPKASAQIKSAVLLAGLSGGVPVSVWEPGQSRDHTERMLSALGARMESREDDGGWLVRFEPPSGPLAPLDFAVPGDPSSAAFPAALALLADAGELRLEGVDLNPTRTGFFRAVERMGARIETVDEREQGGEPVGDLVVHASALRGIEVGGEEVPSMIDELPVLAALAARAEGETVVRGAEELRAKESDRIAALVSNLRALGVEAEEFPDGFAVRGSDRPLSGQVRTHHDHRIAMAFGVLAALPGNRITIEAPEVVDVSFPGYWELLRSLTRSSNPNG